MKKSLLFILSLFLFLQTRGQSEVVIQVTPLTPYQIGEVVLDREPFFQFTRQVKTAVEDFFAKEQQGQDVKILFTIHPMDSVDIYMAAKPALSTSINQELVTVLREIQSPNTRISDYSFEMNIQIEGGVSDPYLKFEPEVLSPLERTMNVFNELKLAEKRKTLKRWVFEEVIPILIYHETSAKETYQAVRSIGKVLLSQRFMTEDVEILTNQNPAYWQAILEMEKGNQIIPFSKACIQLVRGDFDKAIRLLEAIRLFSDRESIPFFYFEEIFQKMVSIDQELNVAMNEPLNLVEKGKYKQAADLYEALLDILPQSARVQCELFYAKSAQLKTDQAVQELWQKSKDDVLGNDPLYPVKLKPVSPEDAYQIQRRREAATLFQIDEEIKKDFISYADIALELGNYGFAGELYWFISQYFTEQDFNNRDMSLHFLYCLKKLGDDQLILAYEGNYSKEFEKIEQDLKKAMKKSEVYKTFRKK